MSVVYSKGCVRITADTVDASFPSQNLAWRVVDMLAVSPAPGLNLRLVPNDTGGHDIEIQSVGDLLGDTVAYYSYPASESAPASPTLESIPVNGSTFSHTISSAEAGQRYVFFFRSTVAGVTTDATPAAITVRT